MVKTIQGFVLLDVDVAALNNAGSDSSSHFTNAMATKKILKGGKTHAYVSGQAWRYWWRETLREDLGWELSPVIREKQVAFTEADPIKYPDDDLFGYMRAKKIKEEGSKKTTNITLTRVSPLKNSALISVAPTAVVQNWSSMARNEGDSVPYGKDEYCCVFKGMFSLHLDSVGTFSNRERTGYKNINEGMHKEAIAQGASEIDDPLAQDQKNPSKLCQLNKETRLQRVKDLIEALRVIHGGAKLTTNYADVTPKVIVLALFDSANHPFSHLAVVKQGQTFLSLDSLKEVMEDYKDKFAGKIFIGRREGFLDEQDPELKKLAENHPGKVFYGSVAQAIKGCIQEVEETF